eukprot:NODE_26_length_35450_cov_0.398320.p9 type:complete len:338 gc:universal NODE_26_length_35450_cov_0.398320:24123-25136(+)
MKYVESIFNILPKSNITWWIGDWDGWSEGWCCMCPNHSNLLTLSIISALFAKFKLSSICSNNAPSTCSTSSGNSVICTYSLCVPLFLPSIDIFGVVVFLTFNNSAITIEISAPYSMLIVRVVTNTIKLITRSVHACILIRNPIFCRSIRFIAAFITTQAVVASGRYLNMGNSTKVLVNTKNATNTWQSGVSTLALCDIILRANDPYTGIQPKRLPTRLVKPSATSSLFLLIAYPFTAANDLLANIDSKNPITVITPLGPINVRIGTPLIGSCIFSRSECISISPTIATPYDLKSKIKLLNMLTTTNGIITGICRLTNLDSMLYIIINNKEKQLSKNV